ncbi:thiaminase II [Aerococcaceae bacterium DSM 109653]|uniref:Aminopyrimidine aminohydrolase n=1 Tax=Fundicoccus ignavus TaxID=2664442 RepID=A0A844BYP3_9LACT|nr:thiaminase II [Fundicoccus ignavus]MRI82759.1 thiaminase II [Fundicoccus ignavus]
MTFTQDLYGATQDILKQYFNHPFIKGIENGNLDIEKFKFYMIQDYLYLYDYAKLFAIGILKSDNNDDMNLFASSLNSTLNTEMAIHRGYMERLGISEEDVSNTETSLINLSYTNYMLSIAQKGGQKEVIIALLSCAWTYAEIAKKINENNSSAKEHEFYGEWVSGYLDDSFQNIAQWFLTRVDQFGEYLSDVEKTQLTNIFRNCCVYELKFWDMAEKQSLDFSAEEVDYSAI